jgi:hypothetical protein
MPNVPLTYLNVHQRVGKKAHTLTYVTPVRHSVTAPLETISLFDSYQKGGTQLPSGILLLHRTGGLHEATKPSLDEGSEVQKEYSPIHLVNLFDIMTS